MNGFLVYASRDPALLRKNIPTAKNDSISTIIRVRKMRK